MYKISVFIVFLVLGISSVDAQKTSGKSLGSVSLTYQGLFNLDTDLENTKETKFHSYSVATVAAYSVTKRLAIGYKFGIQKSIEESDTDGFKTINKSITHGPIVRYYYPIVNKITAFSDISYTRHVFDPEKTKYSDGSQIIGDLELRGNQFKLDYGFAFYPKRFLSIDLKMNIASYNLENTYQKEFDAGKMTRIDSQKEFKWNLNGFTLSKATIAIRVIFR